MSGQHVQSRIQAGDTAIEIANMHKWFGAFHVLQGHQPGHCPRQRVMVCGPSGFGPTSVLDPEMISEVLDTMIDLASTGMTMPLRHRPVRSARGYRLFHAMCRRSSGHDKPAGGIGTREDFPHGHEVESRGVKTDSAKIFR